MGMRDAYERLLLDAVSGDASLFTRSDEIELSWAVVDPYIEAWETELASQLYPYQRGTWGPSAADQFVGDNRTWSNSVTTSSLRGRHCNFPLFTDPTRTRSVVTYYATDRVDVWAAKP